MNDKLEEIYYMFRRLRSMQEIVNEIDTLEYYVYNFDEGESIKMIDFCITKYGEYIKRIGSLYKDMVVVENNPKLYEEKDSIEINSDVDFIRDCLIIIGAVQSGMRPSLEAVVNEIKGRS